MPRKFRNTLPSGRKILLVDDDQDYVDATRKLIENEGHAVSVAANGPDALRLVRDEFFDLILVDYYMPKMTGEEFVAELRKTNSFVQVILQTGYASEQPPRELIRRLEIQGYYNKSEGPEKLLLWVDVGLKAAYTVQLLHRSREGLNYILNVTPDLHRIRPLGDLLQGILLQVSGLLGISNSFLAVLPYPLAGGKSQADEGFVAVVEGNSELVINAGTGKYVSQFGLEKYLRSEEIEAIYNALRTKTIDLKTASTIIPLHVGDVDIGIIYLDQKVPTEEAVDLLKIFANQAAVAIHNTRLYHMATFDPLTKVYLRGIFMESLTHELRVAFRSGEPMAVLLLDVDGMKQINDSIGHLAGDRALEIIGQALHHATRQTDVRGRIGGDEFAVVLPNSTVEGAQVVCGRIYAFLTGKTVAKSDGAIPIRCCIGTCSLNPNDVAASKNPLPMANQYFQAMAKKVLKSADRALYEAKKQGNTARLENAVIAWCPYDEAMAEYDAGA